MELVHDVITPDDFVRKWKHLRLLSNPTSSSLLRDILDFGVNPNLLLQVSQDFLLMQVPSLYKTGLLEAKAQGIVECARLAGDRVTLRQHFYTPAFQLTLTSSMCKFAGVPPTILYELSRGERDDSYLTEEQVAQGQRGWMSCGTEYFLATETAKALEAFELLKADQNRKDSGLSTPNLLHTLGVPTLGDLFREKFK